ncbi:endonuclease NucS domain-containing protein [Deinococcus peraridilitoris]|uniref:endonuclease NucS domain-containing protein n=1 Tax=Deinococcus peraridilitoris TaxID=432329 RepID=UPI000314E19D|nr:endonuclease NucS domain-containing protein [Deinococcus peraridilitoris]
MLRDQLLRPTPNELSDFLNLHLRVGGCLVQIAGECEVLYHGRAMSMAEAGNYLVIIKCDGSVMVHGPKSVKPINWQPRTDE